MVAESLLRDGDLSLERDYAEGRYAAFHDAPLEPHYRVRGLGGAIYSLHAVGLSVLVLPAWIAGWIAGRDGLHGSAVGARGPRGAGVGAGADRPRGSRRGGGVGGGARLRRSSTTRASSSPRFRRRSCCPSVIRRARRPDLGRGGALAVAWPRAALPWLNVRYAPLAVLVARARRLAPPARAHCGGGSRPGPRVGGGLVAYHRVALRLLRPAARVRAHGPSSRASTLAEGLPGLLLDQEFGLLVYAPVLALASLGLVLLWRRDRKLALTAGAAVVAVLLTAGSWHMWRGGFNPPARFLVPIVPLSGWPPRWRGSGGASRPGPRCSSAGRSSPASPGPGARARPPRPRRHGALLPRALRGAGVDAAAAGLRAGRPGPRTGWRPLGRGDPRRPAVALAGRRRRDGRGRRPRPRPGRRSRAAAPVSGAHRRPRRRPPGRTTSRRGARMAARSAGPRGVAGGRRSAGDRSTRRTASRTGPRSAAACPCRRVGTGSR